MNTRSFYATMREAPEANAGSLCARSAAQGELQGRRDDAACRAPRPLCAPKRGFTLIEILIVVAILGILAAILFPVFGRAREGARRASCASNLKQIGLAAIQYAQDNGGRNMRSWSGPDNGPSDATAHYKWMDVLQRYVRNDAVFSCPSDSENKPYHFRDGANYGSYGMNAVYFKVGGMSPDTRLDSVIRDATGTLWVTETVSLGSNSFAFGWPDAASNPRIVDGSPRKLERVIERHLGTVNVLWCDGHVKAVKLEVLAHLNVQGVMSAFTILND